MSNQNYPYPEDEFDTLGANRVPQGVHREPVPRWRQWLPYLLVLILVPALTFVGVKYFFSDSGNTPDSSPTAPVEPGTDGDGDADGDADTDADAGATDEPSAPEDTATDGATDGEDEPGVPADVDQSVSVLILNGARVQGLAGRVTDLLGDQGWTNVTPETYDAAAPTDSTIYYTSADFEAEATAVGEELGITALVEDASSASNGVVVVLRPDFSEPTP